jgi:SPX domain protein involved in polyphosphate accumulation
MPVGKYLQKKRLQKYCQGYIQYEKLIYHLKEVMDLDKRKFSHFAYDIIPNPKGNGYVVTPKVSEEEIEECYSKFVMELRHELDRVDAYFVNFVNQVEVKLNVVKSELFEKVNKLLF